MTRFSIVLGLLCIAGVGCRGRVPAEAIVEAPPPLVEPDLADGSRLIDPRADQLVRQMSERLARVAAFALEAEEVYDEVPEQSPSSSSRACAGSRCGVPTAWSAMHRAMP